MKQSISPQQTPAAFYNLIVTEVSALIGFAKRFSADAEDINDLVQDTLIKALRFSEKFKKGTSLKAWLFTIMRNTYINNYRKMRLMRSKVSLLEDITTTKVVPQSASYNRGEFRFIGKDIEQALKKLPSELYIPFNMFINGYKYHEIARHIGVPIGTIKTRIHKGRANLKKALSAYQYED